MRLRLNDAHMNGRIVERVESHRLYATSVTIIDRAVSLTCAAGSYSRELDPPVTVLYPPGIPGGTITGSGRGRAIPIADYVGHRRGVALAAAATGSAVVTFIHVAMVGEGHHLALRVLQHDSVVVVDGGVMV